MRKFFRKEEEGGGSVPAFFNTVLFKVELDMQPLIVHYINFLSVLINTECSMSRNRAEY